ncbi:MAG: type II secretion system F family protein [Candidatus Methylacidiphilales bacterium]
MPYFSYSAVDATGKQTTGTMEAADTNDASLKIKQQGYFPTTISETSAAAAHQSQNVKKPSSFNLGGGTVKGKVLTVFTRQLATLIDAGLPLLRSLRTLIKQERNPALRSAMAHLADSVESGNTFSEALAQHPKIFNKLYVNMVKAGELGGVLEIVLTRLAEFQEKAQRIRGKVISAMVYPIVVLVIAIGILAFLLLFIVPKFEAIFKDMLGNKPLPLLTSLVIDSSRFVQNNILIIIALAVIGVIVFHVFKKTPAGAATLDNLKLKLPVFGDLISKTSIARFSRTLGTLVTSGVPILQALSITKETAGNIVLSSAINNVHDAVKEGESMVAPLEASGLFPPMVISMIQVGEETGQLPDMLNKVADVYEEEVDVAVAGLTSLLEPVMIVFLAVVVGTIVIALFLPLVSIITELTGA